MRVCGTGCPAFFLKQVVDHAAAFLRPLQALTGNGLAGGQVDDGGFVTGVVLPLILFGKMVDPTALKPRILDNGDWLFLSALCFHSFQKQLISFRLALIGNYGFLISVSHFDIVTSFIPFQNVMKRSLANPVFQCSFQFHVFNFVMLNISIIQSKGVFEISQKTLKAFMHT